MDSPRSSDEIVFRRQGWIPHVIRRDGLLRMELGAGADANHEPRTFSFLISDAHLSVIKADLTRHLLLWFAVLPLCEAAGTQDPFNDEAAMGLLDPILFGSKTDVETLFRDNGWRTLGLVAYNANLELLERGQLFAALEDATEEADIQRSQQYNADKDRAKRGITLTELDAAVLKYTGQYLHRSTLARRRPDAVDPALLPEVLNVLKAGEEASAGMEFPPSDTNDPKFRIDKQRWNEISAAVRAGVAIAYPDLSSDTLDSISSLLCSEAVKRSHLAD